MFKAKSLDARVLFSSITGNSTDAGQPVQLSCTLTDDVAVSSYMFSWNNTGDWVNQTATSVSGASVTATLNGTWNSSAGSAIAVEVYANDSSNNWAVSPQYNFTLTSTSTSVMVVRGMDDRIYCRVENGDSWEEWSVLPGSTIDSPAAAMLGSKLSIVVRGSDGYTLWYGYLMDPSNVTSFSGWALLGGATSSAPTLTSNGTALCLVVRGLDNRIYYRVYDTAAQVWQGWNVLPSGTTCDKPAASMLGSTLNIVVRGYSPTDADANNTLWYSTMNLTSNAFSGWTPVSGATPSSPTLTASQTSNSLCLIVRGNDNRIYYNTWNSGSWQGWNALPSGAAINGPAATIVGGKLYFVVIGMDGASIWQSSLDIATSKLSGWAPLSG